VVHLLQGMGIETRIDLDRLVDAGLYISHALGREPNSRASRMLRVQRASAGFTRGGA
jgi:hydroxymethylglutaryl-CoA lyase